MPSSTDISYVMPKVPTLYSALTTGSAAMDPVVHGTVTNPFVLSKDEIVDIVLNPPGTSKITHHP